MKNRCSRCHAKIDSHRKTCPYCGTLVRKPRGNVRIADPAKPSGVSGLIESIHLPTIDLKYLLAGVAVVVVAVIVVSALGCGGCSGCSGCSGCASCSACAFCGSRASCSQGCASCDSCASCASCDSCAKQDDVQRQLNGANYNCEYYANGTLYYVDGDRLLALKDGSESGTVVARSRGIECVYADKNYAYYIISGTVWRAPLNASAPSGSDEGYSERLLDPQTESETLGVKVIKGFALTDDGEICYWGETPDDIKIICCVDPSDKAARRTLFMGRYSNVQVYRGGVYFASGEEETKNNVIRVDLATGEQRTLFDGSANYFALTDGRLAVCVIDKPEDGSPAESARLLYIDPLTGEEVGGFERFPVIRSLKANDEWVYYTAEQRDADVTEVYRFRNNGEENELIFRSEGSLSLYGIAGDYFSLYGKNVYYICSKERMPQTITIDSHTVLDK